MKNIYKIKYLKKRKKLNSGSVFLQKSQFSELAFGNSKVWLDSSIFVSTKLDWTPIASALTTWARFFGAPLSYLSRGSKRIPLFNAHVRQINWKTKYYKFTITIHEQDFPN